MTDSMVLEKNAVDLFNREAFFACHDALEEIWLEESGSDRLFLQGVLQIAVGFHHVTGGKLGAGRMMMALALEKLKGYPPDHGGIQLEALRREVQEWKLLLDAAIRNQTGCPDRPFPKIAWVESFEKPQSQSSAAPDGN